MPKSWQFCCFFIFLSCLLSACGESRLKQGQVLFEQQCSTCHQLPSIDALPKAIWEEGVLPDMAARMGIKEGDYNPVKDYPYEELLAVVEAKIYSQKPLATTKEWALIKNYILDQAPDSLSTSYKQEVLDELVGFSPEPVSLDDGKGARITFLRYDSEIEKLLIGDMRGNLRTYDHQTQTRNNLIVLGNPVPDFHIRDDELLVTAIGKLNPSEQALGKVFRIGKGNRNRTELATDIHRPVHTLLRDLNQDGKEEMVISEFGHLTGKLSLFIPDDSLSFQKKTISHQVGSIRSIARDMNGDGVEDLVVLAAQGDEGVSIFYQEGDLSFREERVIRFSPISGISWFELLDYDGDGDEDMITVHGDNADKTYIHKPYHGLRIHINDGNNHFEEKYRFPMFGATRSVSRDFDQDGDMDIALIATFPDYEQAQLHSFIYLENQDAGSFTFHPSTFSQPELGRWFLIEAADVDKDGDEDIILASFTYSFTPVPKDLSKHWESSDIDLLILGNERISK